MTEKQMGVMLIGRKRVWRVGLAAFLVMGSVVGAAAQNAQQSQYSMPGGSYPSAPQLQLPKLPVPQAITPNGQVVEDVIARVNDRIITRSEYERAEQGLLQEARQGNATQADFDDRQRNMLRDMIDQQLLLSKGKEMGITGDAETLRQLDEIRKQNHLESMEALQKAAEQQGISFEDFKQSIRDRVITQSVIREEVGRSIHMTHAQEEEYYNAHKDEFKVPEQLHLSEILIPTPDNATDAQVNEAQAKADDTEAKLKAGSSFSDLAKQVSGGPTASAGGDLGDFKRGTLGSVLENATFSLPVGGVTAPIRTRQGFVILRVDAHQQEGVPPLKDVEPQVQEAVYSNAMQPALRTWLTKARDEAYIDIKPGFVDTGSNHKEIKPTFTAYQPPAPKKKLAVKHRLEQERQAQAAAALAESRERVAELAAERAAENARKSGVKDVAGPVKHKHVRREKIRFGEAPRNALPMSSAVAVTEEGAPLTGQAPGVAMAATDNVTTISTGTGPEYNSDDPLAPKEAVVRKSRFTDREKEAEQEHLESKLKHATAAVKKKPVQATSEETADEKHQSGALGLNGDTKKKKRKRQKGEVKERLTEKPAKDAVANKPVVVDPTVNSSLTKPLPSSTAPAAAPAPTGSNSTPATTQQPQ
ncbi:MAG: peptidylprolyl isomerase [Acidobacteriaceae bacterium]|nr:peptidylprolyl isomerase [Acidobacteriaceae bacterium]